MKYLVCLSNFEITLDKVIDLLERDEAILQMNIARFIMMISWPEKKLFAAILKGILSKNRAIIHAPFTTAIIPIDYASMRNMYIEGENSILSNLPHPLVTQMKHHGYVSPIEVIQLILYWISHLNTLIWMNTTLKITVKIRFIELRQYNN